MDTSIVQKVTPQTQNTLLGSEQSEECTTFPFGRLPAELRNNIYEFALVADKHVAISRHNNDGPKARTHHIKQLKSEGREPFRTFKLVGKVEFVRKSGNVISKAFGFSHTTSIMYLNKATYDEARSIMYGKNTFAFANPATFATFVEYHGFATKFLTKLEIGDFTDNSDLISLAGLPKLQQLTLRTHYDMFSGPTMFSEQNDLDNMIKGIIHGVLYYMALGRASCACAESGLCTCITSKQRRELYGMLSFKMKGFGTGSTYQQDKLDTFKALVMLEWDKEIQSREESEINDGTKN